MRYDLILFPVFLWSIFISPLYATIIHVPGDSTTIQGGINGAVDGDTVMVAPGTYHENNIDFLGKAITVMGTDPDDSTVVAATVVDGDSLGSVFVFDTGEDLNSILAGLTITGGYDDYGGGIYCYYSSPTITNNIITQNSAYWVGGGMYNYESDPTVSHCTFVGNSASRNGGGMHNIGGSPKVSNCTFTENSARTDDGGGMYNNGSGPTVSHCAFIGNSASRNGGGMFNYWNSPTVSNCTFTENSAINGGGIYNQSCLNPTISNCIFTGNSATWGGGIHNTDSSPVVDNCTFSQNDYYGMYNSLGSDPRVINCILWDNLPIEIYNWDNSSPIVTYSDVQGGYTGEGNIDADPLFLTFHGFDYLLGRGSPCIDSGHPALEDGINWPGWYQNGLRSDMGTYGGPGNVGWLPQ
jgi:predicted outer membrane repeat protein